MKLLDDGTYAITLSTRAFLILGMDDAARYPDIRRWGSRARYIGLSGSFDALTELATELLDRATEDETGFGESAENKRICRRAVASLERQGVYARD